MALFSNTSEKKTKAAPKAVKTTTVDDGRLDGVISAPWFSEKALIGTEKGVYVFQVPGDSTKTEIAAAIEKFYNVAPRKIRIANLPAKKVSLRTRRGQGVRARRHKAYVYLKAGDTIQFG